MDLDEMTTSGSSNSPTLLSAKISSLKPNKDTFQILLREMKRRISDEKFNEILSSTFEEKNENLKQEKYLSVEKKPKSSINEDAKAREKVLYLKENILSIGEIRALAYSRQFIQIQLPDFESFIADPRSRFNVPKDPKELREITSFWDSVSNGYQFGHKYSRYVNGKSFNLYLSRNNINTTSQIQEFCFSNGYSPLHVEGTSFCKINSIPSVRSILFSLSFFIEL